MIGVSKIQIIMKNYKVMTTNSAVSTNIYEGNCFIGVAGLQVTTLLNLNCLTGILQGFFFLFRNTRSTDKIFEKNSNFHVK